MKQLDAGQRLEQLAGHMGQGSGPGRHQIDPAGIAPGVGDEFRHGPGWYRRGDLHDEGHPSDACDRRDIAIEVEVELEHRRVDGIDHGNQQQRVAARRRPPPNAEISYGGEASCQSLRACNTMRTAEREAAYPAFPRSWKRNVAYRRFASISECPLFRRLWTLSGHQSAMTHQGFVACPQLRYGQLALS